VLSRSKALLDAFRHEIKNSDVEELDLCTDVPDLFTPERMEAFYARYIVGTATRDTPMFLLAKMDRMTAQLRSADIVVLAFPMHNFSLPAPVKAWFDSVIRGGETFDRQDGNYVGLMAGKRAVVLVAAGGTYRSGSGVGPWFGPAWEHAVRLAELEFRFMGFSEIHGVLAEGQVIGDAGRSTRFLEEAVAQVHAIARRLYGSMEARPEPLKAA
jgi:FMN-dependent NADH-azoreductase